MRWRDENGYLVSRMDDFHSVHNWGQLFTVDTIWNIGETGDIHGPRFTTPVIWQLLQNLNIFLEYRKCSKISLFRKNPAAWLARAIKSDVKAVSFYVICFFFFVGFGQQLNLFAALTVKDFFLLLFYVVFPVLKALSNSDYLGKGKEPQCAFLFNFVHQMSVDIVANLWCSSWTYVTIIGGCRTELTINFILWYEKQNFLIWNYYVLWFRLLNHGY